MGSNLSGVGYRRPPREHCWKKGECGNPKGRPRGHRNLAAALSAVLHESTSLPVDGEDREMTKLEAVTRRLVEQALDGDPRLIRDLLAEIHKKEAQAEFDASNQPLAEVDREVLQALYARVRQEAAKDG